MPSRVRLGQAWSGRFSAAGAGSVSARRTCVGVPVCALIRATTREEKDNTRDAGPAALDSVGWTTAKTLRLVSADAPMELELGGRIGPVDVEYETYGTLSPRKDNVIFIGHALSGDAHVAGWDKETESNGRSWRRRKPGWWDAVVGPGKAIDTQRYFVICPNVLGSCYGTTGPASLDPKTGKPYGLAFPMVTEGDLHRLRSDELPLKLRCARERGWCQRPVTGGL